MVDWHFKVDYAIDVRNLCLNTEEEKMITQEQFKKTLNPEQLKDFLEATKPTILNEKDILEVKNKIKSIEDLKHK